MDRPKLIFVNRFFYPDESATSQLLTDLAMHLAGGGWDVHVVTSRRQGKSSVKLKPRKRFAGLQIHRVWNTDFGRNGSMLGRAIDYACFYPTALLALLQQAKRGDIIVAKTDPPLISLVAFAAAKIRGAKLVNWLQDLYPEVAMALGITALKGPIGRLLTVLRNKVLRSACSNVVIGQRMGSHLRSAGVREERIYVLPNWSLDEQVVPVHSSASRARRDWGIADQEFVVGYSGNLGRAHESETILAAAELLKEREDIRFLFVGGGHERENLQEAISSSGLTSFIFKNHQPQNTLGDTLAAADVHWLSLKPQLEGLIVPSKFYGIAAAGRPVIAVVAKMGEIAEIIRSADCGYVVEPGDAHGLAAAIRHLADDSITRAAMGKRARAAVDQKFARRLALARWEWIFGRSTGADLILGPYPAPSLGGTRAR